MAGLEERQETTARERAQQYPPSPNASRAKTGAKNAGKGGMLAGGGGASRDYVDLKK